MEKAALKGITILEIGDQLTQFAGKLLADMGAQVIKVEPKKGAPSRNIGPFYKDIPDKNGSLYFWNYNTSKKSITLDLNTKEGQEKLLHLLDDTDVFLEGIQTRALGQTPLSDVKLPVGSVLIFRHPSYPEKRVRVQGTETTVQIAFP